MTVAGRAYATARLRGADRAFRAVLFDVDGTLVDSIGFLVECFVHASREVLARELVHADVAPLIGMPLGEMYRAVEPGRDDALYDRCIECYRALYLPQVVTRCAPFPDAPAVVRALGAAGLGLAVVSGKNTVGIERVLEPPGLLGFFPVIIGADYGGPGKPAPGGAIAAASALGVSPDECLVVGDSLLDTEMGVSAGMMTCGVTTGTATRAGLEDRADCVVGSLSELQSLLELVPE